MTIESNGPAADCLKHIHRRASLRHRTLPKAIALALGVGIPWQANGQEFPASVDLALLNGTDGFRVEGNFVVGGLGYSLENAGDVNGDGLDDLIIGSYSASPPGEAYAGITYVVFGQDEFPPSFSVDDLSPDPSDLFGQEPGFRIFGVETLDRSGRAVSGAGDVNGDGLDDLIIGASFAAVSGNFEAGSSFVVFGRDQAAGDTFPPLALPLSGLDGSTGFRVNGVAENNRSGEAVSAIGDVNGDGLADVIIGAAGARSSYVVFGRNTGFGSALALSSLDGNSGFRIDGASLNGFGRSVNEAGDIDGDGIDDLVIGAPFADASTGRVVVIFGQQSGFPALVPVANLGIGDGFEILGQAPGDRLGASVSNAGDLNSDGINDLVIGAYLADPDGNSGAGRVYVLFGRNDGFGESVDLSTLDGGNGFRVDGAGTNSYLGRSVSMVDDVNGDGRDDLLMGAHGTSSRAGAAFLLFGRAQGQPFPPAFNVSSLSSVGGVRFDGVSNYDDAGFAVSSAGDINGDGLADIAIGARGVTPGSVSNAGTAYVVFGRSERVFRDRFQADELP